MEAFISLIFIIWFVWYVIKVGTQGNSSHSSKVDSGSGKIDTRKYGPIKSTNSENLIQPSIENISDIDYHKVATKNMIDEVISLVEEKLQEFNNCLI